MPIPSFLLHHHYQDRVRLLHRPVLLHRLPRRGLHRKQPTGVTVTSGRCLCRGFRAPSVPWVTYEGVFPLVMTRGVIFYSKFYRCSTPRFRAGGCPPCYFVRWEKCVPIVLWCERLQFPRDERVRHAVLWSAVWGRDGVRMSRVGVGPFTCTVDVVGKG